MNNLRTLMLSAIAGGIVLGLLGSAQVSTTMKPGPEMPFRWAQGWTPPTASARFADNVPLELDVPPEFQLRSASIDGDPASPDRATGRQPRTEWASLRLAQYKVDAPDVLPEPDRFAGESYGASGDAQSAAGANAGLETVLASHPPAGEDGLVEAGDAGQVPDETT